MKTYIAAAFVFVLLFASTASFASTTSPLSECQFPPDHPITNETSDIVACIKADVWQKAMADQSATMMGALPTFRAGDSVSDEHGVVYQCPVWFLFFRCVDATKTPEYKAYMESLARELIAKGIDRGYPAFSGWVASVR